MNIFCTIKIITDRIIWKPLSFSTVFINDLQLERNSRISLLLSSSLTISLHSIQLEPVITTTIIDFLVDESIDLYLLKCSCSFFSKKCAHIRPSFNCFEYTTHESYSIYNQYFIFYYRNPLSPWFLLSLTLVMRAKWFSFFLETIHRAMSEKSKKALE